MDLTLLTSLRHLPPAHSIQRRVRLRSVIPALFLGLWLGAWLLAGFHAILRTFQNRDSAELHFQFGLFNGLLYASTRYVNVDYANTTQDLYLIQNVVRFRARPWNRVGLTFEINNEKQTSGNTEQVTRVELFNAEWRLRKLKMLAEVRHMSTTYGTSETEILYINLSVRRDF